MVTQGVVPHTLNLLARVSPAGYIPSGAAFCQLAFTVAGWVVIRTAILPDLLEASSLFCISRTNANKMPGIAGRPVDPGRTR